MRILLLGEYSRLHNSLKEGLLKHGHEVVIFGFNDGFKAYPVDYQLFKVWNRGIKGKVKNGIYKLTGFDISSYFTYRQFLKYKGVASGYDIVQLINENTFDCTPYFEIKILKYLFRNNKSVFLLSCGDDYYNVKFYFDHPEIKSVIQPYLAGKIKDQDFLGVLKFRSTPFQKLHKYIYKHIEGVIATDLDYHIPLVGHPKYLGLIPNPINTDKMVFVPLSEPEKITIFLGINIDSYYKKGSDYFEEALEIIKTKYPGQTEIIITRNVPYERYINLYDKAHIVLDQTFSHDQGYNALEAMAKGKVVFTGAEPEFFQYYNLVEPVNINATASTADLVTALSNLINNPIEITAISNRGRKFIEKEHHYFAIASRYLDTWKNKERKKPV